MSRILLLGLDPETVDDPDPALPPGMTAEKVHAGVAVALQQFTDRGWDTTLVTSARTKPPDRQWSDSYVRRTTIVWSSEPACACRPAILHYSKWSSTRFVVLPQARRSPSIHGRTIVLMLPPEGWR